MAGICGLPDFSSLFDKANGLLDRVFSLLYLLLIVGVLLIIAWGLVNFFSRGHGRG